jgi:hypothetical protein
MSDNLFDDDDALDYILYEECEKEQSNTPEPKGCLSTIALVLLPIAGLLYFGASYL